MRQGELRGRAAHPLRELAGFFLKLGTIAFGGPAAHIAMMDAEVVRRRGWLTREQFLDLLGAANLIPGPNSTEMAIYIGLVRAGWRGLIAAGTCFILPAMLIVLALAMAYVRYGALPQVVWLLYGVKPVIIAIVIQALWSLGTKAVKGPLTGAVGIAVMRLSLLGVNVVLLLFAGGFFRYGRGESRASWGREGGRSRAVRPDPARRVARVGGGCKGGGGAHQPLVPDRVFPQGGLDPVRERVRAAGVSPGGLVHHGAG